MRLLYAALLGLAGMGSVWAAELPTVIIDPGGVPPAALKSINQAVEAITRLAIDQDGGEVSRLRRRAHQATLSALETQGYFSPVVTLEVGKDVGGETWDIIIEPGERTVVHNVDIQFSGRITDAAFAERMHTLREEWSLKPEMPFINSDWSTAKEQLLYDVSRKDFYFARYASTRAAIRADDAQADLSVAVKSGPPVQMGKLRVEGLKRVPRKLVERYVQYEEGEGYDQERLDEWQQDLADTFFFRGAFVTLDEADEHQRVTADGAMQLPVKVEVTEAAARSGANSIGVDSDYGVRGETLYRQNVVFGQPVRLETGAGIDRKRQRGFLDVHLPPSRHGYRDSVGVLAANSNIEGVHNSRAGLGWTRTQERKAAGDSRVDYRTRLGVVLAYDKTSYKDAESFRVPTAVATWQWLRRDVDNIYDPREGNLVEVGLGAGLTLDRRQPFYRSHVRAQKWWPVGRHDVLTLRGEIGKVWSDTHRLPEDFGYRTGGSRSIRGYRYKSIGERRGRAVVGAKAMGLVSLEYSYFFTPDLGMNIFVDAGDAAPSFKQMRWHVGYGLGAIYRTPAGPFSVDLAYGQRDKRVRLHFSLGIAF